ncbi:WbqC family protein [Legionella dresdenensis]|uniref:WbqC family protein n=1 Tax=Legionella dresdenensis TaxID=450200 RepID=A0ABV8CCL4_9GAMM
MKKIAISQSNYIPWKGYFDMIAAVDEFILYDEMQFTKNDWRNRNKIKTPKGTEWISIPVGQDINRTIREVVVPAQHWQRKHWAKFECNYRKAAHYEEIAQILAPAYEQSFENLSALNRYFIELVCNYLGIKTKISNSWDYELNGCRNERIINLCIQAGASEYVSGPAARCYIDPELFNNKNITLTWFNYDYYPPYQQLWGDFIGSVSIIDLLFNCGEDSKNYMRYVSQ